MILALAVLLANCGGTKGSSKTGPTVLRSGTLDGLRWELIGRQSEDGYCVQLHEPGTDHGVTTCAETPIEVGEFTSTAVARGPWGSHQVYSLIGQAPEEARDVRLETQQGRTQEFRPMQVDGIDKNIYFFLLRDSTPLRVIALNAEGEELGREPIPSL